METQMFRKSLMAAIAVSMFGAGAGGFAGPTSALAGQADKVTICHFSGHEGTFVFEGVQYTVHDFVTYYAKPRAVLCEQVGAQAITVSRQACENGHHAIQVFENRTCADGALQE